MAWFKEVFVWALASYCVLYNHITGVICALVVIFKASQTEPILPIAVTRNSFNNEFNPVSVRVLAI